MKIKTEALKEVCSKILNAVDNSTASVLSETLELKTDNNILYFNVTNGDYFVSVKFDLATPEQFHATINADLFLKLIANTSTAEVELTTDATSLIVNCNGSYKLPLIYDGQTLLALPDITITNKTLDFDIDGSVFPTILKYNIKELKKGVMSVKDIQSLFYLDENGCITFTSGACINDFKLSNPVKLVLEEKIIKLLKLFKDNKVNFNLGQDSLANGAIQTKVKIETQDIILTAIISCDNTLLNKFPVQAIRDKANSTFPYSTTIDKNLLNAVLTRLLLFHKNKKLRAFGKVIFEQDGLTIWGTDGVNSEKLKYSSACNVTTPYSTTLELNDLQATLESCGEQIVSINFGANQSMVIARGNIKNLIPEVIAKTN